MRQHGHKKTVASGNRPETFATQPSKMLYNLFGSVNYFYVNYLEKYSAPGDFSAGMRPESAGRFRHTASRWTFHGLLHRFHGSFPLAHAAGVPVPAAGMRSMARGFHFTGKGEYARAHIFHSSPPAARERFCALWQSYNKDVYIHGYRRACPRIQGRGGAPRHTMPPRPRDLRPRRRARG